MNRIEVTRRLILYGVAALITFTGGALAYGLQGVLAAPGLLSLIAMADIGIYIVKKVRLYTKAKKYAENEHSFKLSTITIDDKNWIMNHLDEYFAIAKNSPEDTVDSAVSVIDRNKITNHLDEFMAEIWSESHSVSEEDKAFIMANLDILFDNNLKQDGSFPR